MNWLAFGDLRGHIESCGCDPLTDLGGIARLATLLERERRLHSDLFVFNLGHVFTNKKSANTNKFIIKGLAEIGFVPTLIRSPDLKHLDDMHVAGVGPLILSNASISLRKQKPHLRQWVKSHQAIIFGYSWSTEMASEVSLVSDVMIKEWRDISKDISGSKIMLFSGPDHHLKSIITAQIFDTIISSNQQPEGTYPGLEEKEQPSLLVRRHHSPQILTVPLGGLGVLRGGGLQQESRINVIDISQKKCGLDCDSELLTTRGLPSGLQIESTEQFSNRLAGMKSHYVSWLDRSYDEDSPLKALMKEYTKDAAVAFNARAVSRASGLAASKFIGASACKSCHAAAYKVWQESKHARALQTLKQVGKHQAAACVNCHVLAFSQEGGYVSEKKSPHFAGVQCESCHGPRRAHATAPQAVNRQAVKGSALKVCVSCHHVPHSSAFDQKQYWSKIIHGF